MMVSNRGSVLRLILWQWRLVGVFILAGLAPVLIHRWTTWDLVLPALPMAVVGGALGIFVSFRSNSSYDRWWEGRKLWGRLINSSRHLCNQILSYAPRDPGGAPSALQRALITRHIAYVNVLRLSLRAQDPWRDEDLLRHLQPEELAALPAESNPAHALLHAQAEQLAAAARGGLINDFQLQKLDDTLASLLDIQGGCERIKKTPIPRGYGFIAERLILTYGLLFPWVLIQDMRWGVIPANVLVGLCFALISEAGRVLEDPFTMFWNGLPLSSISRMIEVNLRQRLGDKDLPPQLGVDERGILM
jgi:putative membrane protein